MGGADPNNDTLEVLKKCQSIKGLKNCFVIIGGAYQHRKQLDKFILQTSLNIELLSNINASQMLNYMQKCGTAVTSPSSISFEYLSIGGLLFSIVTANNQREMHHYYLDNKLAYDFSSIDNFSEFSYADIIKRQSLILDGHQSTRLCQIFKTL